MASRRVPNDPQGDLFRAPLPPAVEIPRVARRPPTARRAGTRIDHAPGNAVELFCHYPMRGGTQSAGWIDRRQRLFQTGGLFRDFVYFKHKPPLVTYPADLWNELTTTWAQTIDVLEYVDSVAGRVYRCAFSVGCAEGVWYEAGIGPRWGVPLDRWEVE